MKNTKVLSWLLWAILSVTIYFVGSSSVFAQDKSQTKGIDHIGLTVTDLDASTTFFTQHLGWRLLGKNTAYPATFVSDGYLMISLWQVKDPVQAIAFDRKKNVGLHHLAIATKSFAALEGLYHKLKKIPGVTIEFAPEPAYGGPAKHMMVREPSGNRIEFKFTP